jgi:hypothetical protein
MIEFEVVERAEPLAPCAALALDGAAPTLAERLLRFEDERLVRLRGVAGANFLLVTGAGEDLPWCEGIRYLGRDAEAPALLVPTAVTLDVPLALFERAIRRRLESLRQAEFPPWAISFAPELVIATGAAQPIARSRVLEFVARMRASSP